MYQGMEAISFQKVKEAVRALKYIKKAFLHKITSKMIKIL